MTPTSIRAMPLAIAPRTGGRDARRSRKRVTRPSPAIHRRWPLLAGLVLLAVPPTLSVAATTPARPGAGSCQEALARTALGPSTDVATVGRTPVEASFDVPPGRELLIEAREQGNDVILEVAPVRATSLRSDSPVRRAGRESVIVPPGPAGALKVRLTGKEHAAVAGRASIQAFDLGALVAADACARALRALAAADADYARGQSVTLAQAPARKAAARHAYLAAVEEYSLAYQLLDARTDPGLRLDTALAIAAAYYQDLQNWAGSAEWAGRAAALAVAERREYEGARAQALLAASWIESATQSALPAHTTGTPAPARLLMARARGLLRDLDRLHRRRGEPYDAALAFNNVGLAYFYEARFAAAELIFTEAIDRFGAIREWPRQGVALQNLALCEWARGDLVASVQTFRRALAQLGPDPYPRLYLMTLNNSALANFAIGDFDAALGLSTRALAYARTVQQRQQEGRSLYGLGVIYYALGDRELARQYLEEALTLLTADTDARGRVTALRALSTLNGDSGRLDAAIAADEEALALSTSPSSRARMLVRLATDNAALGRFEEALGTLAAVLADGRRGDPGARALALIARARIRRMTGGLPEAVADLESALPVVRRLDDLESQFRAELELARSLRQLRRPAAALAAVDRALARSEELRRQTANPELRAQRQEPLRPAYDLKIALLADEYRRLGDAGQPLAAQRVSLAALATAERQRAQSMADLSSLKFATAGDQAPQLRQRERLYREIAARRFRLEDRVDSSGAGDARAEALRADIAGLRRELDALNSTIARQAGVRESVATLRPDGWAAELRKRASGAVIVDYWLGADAAYAWTITEAGIAWHPLGESAPIAAAARSLHEALTDFSSRPLNDRTESAARLYDLVVRPVAAAFAGSRPVVFIADGALTYVPFAALRDRGPYPAHYLIEQHDVSVAPAAWWLMTLRPDRRPAGSSGRILAVSDPIYGADDERLLKITGAHPAAAPGEPAPAETESNRLAHLKRLPWTAREAAIISALAPPGSVDQLAGAAATRSQVLAEDWSRYRVIHLASHGHVDAGMPQLSGLLLGAYDERGRRVEQSLRAADLEPLELNADVMVLSACETALGKDVVGEGSVGFAYTAMARGARAVIASLWQVPDEISAQVMTGFYRAVLRERRGPTSALGAAMRSVLARQPLADPALWAPFQVSVSRLEDAHRRRAVDSQGVSEGRSDEARQD